MPFRKRVTYSQHPNHRARAAHARGEREFKTYDTSGIRPKRALWPRIVVGIVAVLILLGLGFAVASIAQSCVARTSPELAAGQEVAIKVPEGASLSSVGKQLQDAGLIKDAREFTHQASAAGLEKSLAPGDYLFQSGQSIPELISLFKMGPNAGKTLVVPEGSTVKQTAQAVEKAYGGKITAADFEAKCADASSYAKDYSFLDKPYNNSLEGYLFPKTYPVLDNATADTVVRQMLDQFKTEFEQVNMDYARSKNLTVSDVVILASVIEKESGPQEAENVSSVFYNRLKKDMPLQSDVTVAYVIGREPKPADLKVDSPYNTYINKGLPAGPICSPGLECLQAAAKPAQTDYLYFYSVMKDGKPQFFFSHDYDQHKKVIAEN